MRLPVVVPDVVGTFSGPVRVIVFDVGPVQSPDWLVLV